MGARTLVAPSEEAKVKPVLAAAAGRVILDSFGIPPEQEAEIELLRENIAKMQRGEMDIEDFRKFRVENGIYGIRGTTDQHMVRVRVRYGVILPEQLERLAEIADAHTPNHQVHITTGADTCRTAVTRCRGLALELDELFRDGIARHPDLEHITVRISGCPNSCGHHHIADIGLYGASRKVNGQEAPHYIMLLGGSTDEGNTAFARPVIRLPARQVRQAIQRVLNLYLESKIGDETFRAWVKRTETKTFKALLRDLTELPPFNEAPEVYEDLGAEGQPFKVQVEEGECAA